MMIYLVKLSCPLLIYSDAEEERKLTPLYGFYYQQDLNEQHHPSIDDLCYYLGHLAVVHEWNTNSSLTDFSVESENIWIDNKTGERHPVVGDIWSLVLGEQCRRKLNLGGTLYVVDIDEVTGSLLDKGCSDHFIIDESLMNYLVELAQQQKKIVHTVCLFNRPIWLPKDVIWDGDGYVSIFGTVSDRELDYAVKSDINYYLGYLALCEEYYLSGTTPSGYSTNDFITWYRNGKAYDAKRREILEEGLICKDKYNLKVFTAKLRIPAYGLACGVRDGIITDQELYEKLIGAARKRLKLDVEN